MDLMLLAAPAQHGQNPPPPGSLGNSKERWML
jgi:hypothetical protein